MKIALSTFLFFSILSLGFNQTTDIRYTEEEVTIEKQFIEAKKYKLLGDIDASIELFKELLKKERNHDAAAFELAEALNKEGTYEDALHYINLAIGVDPVNKWYLLLKSDILSNEKKYAEAATVFETLTKQHPEDYYFLERKAFLYKQAGDLNKAIEVLDDLESKQGITEKTAMIKHDLYVDLGKKNKAISELENLIAKFPLNTDYKHTLANYYNEINKTSQADQLYEEILATDPLDARANVALASDYRKEGKSENYLTAIQPIIESQDADIDLKIAELMPYVKQLQEGKGDDLAPSLLQLIEVMERVHPQEAKCYALHGDVLSLTGRYDESIVQYEKTLELDESNYLVWEQLLMTQAQLGKMEALYESSSRALEIFPNQAMIYYLNGLASIDLEKYDEASDGLEQALFMAGQNEALRFNILALLGTAYFEEKKFEESFDAYESAIRIKPNEPRILNDYSYHLALKGDRLDEAQEMMVKALKQDPSEPRFLATQGWIYYRQLKLDESRSSFEESIKNGGDNYTYILEKYGDVLYTSEQVDKAVKYWKMAKKLGGGSQWLDRKITEEKLIEAQ